MNLTQACCAVLLSALLAPPALAKVMPSGRPTAAEMRALPDYCQARFGTDENLRNAFSQKFGPKHYIHIHHHCIGLNVLNRSRVTLDKSLQRYYLNNAISQFNYVLARWPADFPLTAEARRGKQSAQTMLGLLPKGR